MSQTGTMHRLRDRLPTLARKAIGNSGVLFGSTLGQALLRFASTVIITRFVTPDDYGINLILGSLAGTLVFLSETGVAPFTIRTERGDTPRALDTVWTVSVIRGAIIGLILFLTAPLAAEVFDDARLTEAIRIGSFGVFFFECCSIGPLLAQRYQNERKNALIRLGVFAVHVPLQIGLAVWLGDYRAFAWGLTLFNAMTLASTFLLYGVRHRFLLDRGVLLELWRFSRMIAASSVVGLVLIQFERFFVAGAASLAVAGLFSMALQLTTMAEELIGRHARGIYMPVAAAMVRAGERGPQAYYPALRIARPGLVALCCAGIPAGPAFFAVAFEPEYAGAGVFLSLFSLRCALVAMSRTQSSYLLADDGQRLVFYADAARMVWTVGAGVAGYLAFGLFGLILAVALRELPPLVVQTHALMRRGVFSWRGEVTLLPAVLLGLAVGAAAAAAASAAGLYDGSVVWPF